MKLVTSDQMRRIDGITIRERGIPGAVLMERAGKAVARETMERFEPDSVAVVTGKGNNAGDGFIAARELHRHGIRTALFMLGTADELRGDALDAYQSVPEAVEQTPGPTPLELRERLCRYDLVIDAIFGTGIKGPLREPWAGAVEAINACRMNVVAVDIPSGLPGEHAEQVGPHVRAGLTVTIGLPKIGMMLEPGIQATGAVVVADIGFPPDLLADDAITVNLLTHDEVRRMLPARRPSGHKGTFGRVMILAGSEGMTGSAILAARAAARSGVGLVFSAYPRPLGQFVEGQLVEPVKIPLDGQEGWFTEEQAEAAVEAAGRMQAVAVGPGLGTRPTTAAFMEDVINKVEAPLLIDADGLNLIAAHGLDLSRRPGPTILTPHPGEAARLMGRPIDEIERDRLGAALELASTRGAVVVLKGAQTVIADPAGQRYLNPTGNSGLAKGGSGDVLTGLIAGLSAQGCPVLDAARIGVYLHGMAADLAAGGIGVRALIPSDVIDYLGRAFLKLEKRDQP